MAKWLKLIGLRQYSVSMIIGGLLTLLFLSLSVIALFWTPYDPEIMNIAGRLKPPSINNWFGTDQFGRDMFSMIMKGSQNSVAVAMVALCIGMGFGVPLGALAAARGGLIDDSVMRFNDFVFAFPALLSAVIITAVFGPGAINAIVAIGIFNIPVFARVTRAAAQITWQREFALSARALGLTTFQITLRHILPNISGILIVQGTIQFALAILAEAGLSYLGLGAQPPAPSWGKMLFDAQTLMYTSPHVVLIPGLAIAFTIFGLNLLGDGLRDQLDPKTVTRG